MADISLLFDVAGGGDINGESGREIFKQLESIVNTINKNPFKIKFEADETSLNAFKEKIDNLKKEIGRDLKISTGNISGRLGESGGKTKRKAESPEARMQKEIDAAWEIHRAQKESEAKIRDEINKSYRAKEAAAEKTEAAIEEATRKEVNAYEKAEAKKSADLAKRMQKEIDAAWSKQKAEHDAQDAIQRDIHRAYEERNKRIKEEEDAVERASRSEIDWYDKINSALGEDSKSLNDVFVRTNRLEKRLKTVLGFTSAKFGKSQKSYEAVEGLTERVQDLKNNLSTITKEEALKKLKEFEKILSDAEVDIEKNNEKSKTFADRIKTIAKRFSEWFSITHLITQVYQLLRRMVTAVVDIDSAMTELKKVTNETAARYDSFLRNATVRAKNLGAALSDTVRATADFARLGYSIDEAEKMADAAIIYKNVGDGIQDINTASESIIATMQAFGIKANNVMSIVDKFNEVGNNFAVSSSGIGDALLRSAAAMHSAGNTIDETIALVASANTIVQNPETVGTTLKTISMYLRAAKTEAEEAGESTEGMASSVSELREKILDLTGQKVDIMVDEDNFKSTYKIMSELSGIWDTLTDTSRANILEMIGGKRNANIVSALLENFTVAQDALEKSLDSAGSAAKENEKHLESIQGRISLLKAAFESLSSTIVDDDAIKIIISGLTGIISGVDKLIQLLGGLKVLIPAISGLLVTNNLPSIVNLFMSLSSSKLLTGFTKNISVLKAWFTTITTGSRAASSALTMLGGSIQLFGTFASILITVVSLAAIGISNYKRKIEEARQEQIEASKAAGTLSNEITELYDKYVSLSDAMSDGKDVTEEYTAVQNEIIEKLGLTRSELDKLIKDYGNYESAIAHATNEELRRQRLIMLGSTSSYENGVINAASSHKDVIRLIPGKYNLNTYSDVLDAHNNILTQLESLAYKGHQNSGYYSDLCNAYEEIGKAIDEYQNHINELNKTAIQIHLYDAIDTFGSPDNKDEFDVLKNNIVQTMKVANDFKGTWTELENAVDDYLSTQDGFSEFYQNLGGSDGSSSPNQTLEHFREKIITLKTALNEFNQTGEVTSDTYNKVVALGEDCADMFDFASGKTTLNTENMNSYIDSLVKETGAILASNDATADQVAEMARLANEVRAVDKEVDIAIDALSSLADVLKDAIDGTEMSAMQMANLITQYPELASAIQLTTNGYKLEEGAVRSLVRAKAEMLRLDELEAKAKARDRIIAGPGTEQTIANVDKIFSVHGGSIHSFEDYVKIVGGSVTDNWIAGFRDYVEASIMQIERDNAIRQLVSDMLNPDKYVFGEKGPSSAEEVESAFSIAYQKHQHLLAMEQETEQDYLEWLTDAYKQAYLDKQISLDEYYKYQEEVYAKSKELFKDNLNDVDKAIDRKNRKGDSASVIKLYQTQLSRINKEIQKYRELGLDNHSDYIQELESLLWSYQDKLLDVLQAPIDVSKDAADGLSTILELTQDLIKWENEKLIEALEKEKEQYADIINKKKEALALSREQEQRDRSFADKLAEIAKLQSRIDQLALDDSREASAQRSKLEDDLAEMQKSLAEEQADYAYNQQIDALDREYEAFEESKDKEIEGLQNMLSSAEKLYAAAIDRISNNWDSLYHDLETWNLEYGSTLQDDLVSAWDAASDAVIRYGSFVNALDAANTTHKGVSESGGFESSIVNMMKKNSSLWTDSTASGRKMLEDKNVELVGILANYLGKKITRGTDGVWRIDGKKLYDIYHTGGVVGGNGSFSQNETMALLENGEMVLDDKKQRFLLSAAGFIKDLSDRIGSTIDVSKLSALSVFTGKKSNISAMLDKLDSAGGGEFNFQPNVNVYITHNGEMSDAEARRYGETAADAVLEKLNGAFSKRGITHAGHNLIKT